MPGTTRRQFTDAFKSETVGSRGNRAGQWPSWLGTSGFQTMCCTAGGATYRISREHSQGEMHRAGELNRLKRENETLRKDRGD